MSNLIEILANNQFLTALASGLLVVVGIAQVMVSVLQKRQTRVALATQYKNQWMSCRESWGNIIYIGNEPDDYYQILPEFKLNLVKQQVLKHAYDQPTIWALESLQSVCGTLSEICIRILQGHLNVSDAYPIFGTEFLRHTMPMRVLLDNEYTQPKQFENSRGKHYSVRVELQDWLIYHDGVRRRCLILIDMLWAEASRLEDLPPSDIIAAANAKLATGFMNRSRLFSEAFRLHGFKRCYSAFILKMFLGRSEYRNFWNPIGIKKSRIAELEKEWTMRLLRKNNYNVKL